MSIFKNHFNKTGENPQTGHTRRQFMGSLAALGLGGLTLPSISKAGVSATLIENADDIIKDLKITRVRWYKAPSSPMTNQSFHVVTVETDKQFLVADELLDLFSAYFTD